MYEKLGQSIRESNKYRVNIIGFGVKNIPVQNGISFHTLYRGKRITFRRLLAPVTFLRKLIRIQPDLIIVCTPELLIPGAIYSALTRTKLWYDVQENYQRNVIYQDAYWWALKPLLRAVLWLTEHGSRWFVDHYLLAEQGYANELNFVNGKYTVLENKYAGKALTVRPQKGKVIKMIFTGTCSRENGILEAISLVTTLYEQGHPVKLIIAGQIPDSYILSFIQSVIDQMEFIELVGDGTLVPHATIMELASNADFGLVAHQPNPSTENCIPTKIYEYLGLQLPMILQAHPLWVSVVESYPGAVVIDYNDYHPEEIIQKLQQTRFYTKLPGAEISWEPEAVKLSHIL